MVISEYNKARLFEKRFTHTHLFSQEAAKFLKTGKYTDATFGSSKYVDYYNTQRKYCLEGYTNPETGEHIEGYHYFHLNFKPLKIVENIHAKASKRIDAFPRFWAIHWWFFKALREARENGVHFSMLKPRGTGYSEIMSSIATCNYTFNKEEPNFIFAADKRYLEGDGILTKCWSNLNFLNTKTSRLFKHLRQEKDTMYWKRASYKDREGNFTRTGGDIISSIIDDPNKVRGGRGFVFYEEGGSFPGLLKAWQIAMPLVTQGGVTFATMVAWGTGGEEGKGLQGLEDLFYNPVVNDCLAFENCWDPDLEGTYCGFFFPVYACYDKFMDKDGNPDFMEAKKYFIVERNKKKLKDPKKEDAYIAEFPFTPREALMRLTSNLFDVTLAQQQLLRVRRDPAIKGFLKYGVLTTTVDGRIIFKLDTSAKPIDYYPHKKGETLEGCVTMVEPPFKNNKGRVPDNMYLLTADCFHIDSEDPSELESLGDIRVYKRYNNVSPTEDNIDVCWYTGRPKRVRDFYALVVNMALFYNCKIQTEIAGGGQGLLDYCREVKLAHLCEKEPDMVHNRDMANKRASTGYFMSMPVERKKLGLRYFADYMADKRALIENGKKFALDPDKVFTPEEEKAAKDKYVLNYHKCYDAGLLEEITKFREEGNFDRISNKIIQMYMIKERLEVEVQDNSRAEASASFFNRQFHSNYNPQYDSSRNFSPSEILELSKNM